MRRGRHAPKLAVLLLALSCASAGAQPMQLTPPAGQQPPPAQPPRPAQPPQQQQQTPPRPPAPAATGVQQGLSPAQQATLRRINESFNAIREMSGRFLQIEQDGTQTQGRFYISKPGRVRFIYDRPSQLDIVADGTDVVVRDRRMNTQDLYPLAQTPLRYLLNDRIDLMRDARVVAVSQEQDLVSVAIEERTPVAQGRLTLFFDGATFALRQWTIRDARGHETAVRVEQVATNQRNNPQLFAIERQQMQVPRN